MAFNDLQMKTTSEFALQSLYAKLAPIRDFAHNFRELEDRKGASIVVPVFDLSAAAEFNADTNNYCGGTNEIDAATLTLNKHYVKALAVTDRDMAETEIQFYRDGGTAIGDALGRAIYKDVVDMLSAQATLTADVTLTSKQAFADLFNTVYANGLDIDEAVLMLTPANFAKLLGTLDANIYGGPEAIRGGYVPGLYGFKSVVCAPNLGTGVEGYIVDRNSVGVAARYLAPMEGAYLAAWQTSDPNSGLPIGFRGFQNLCTGTRNLAGEILFGSKVIRNAGLIKLT